MSIPSALPKLARKSDPATSHAAARKAIKQLAASQSAIIRALTFAGKFRETRGGVSDEWIRDWSNCNTALFSDSRLRTARCELARAGKVKTTGTSVNSRGNRCQVWTLV